MTFKWEKGSVNDNIIKVLKANNIDFRYNQYFQLEADFLDIGVYYSVGYEREGDIFKIKPVA